jgi:hypothetical protein
VGKSGYSEKPIKMKKEVAQEVGLPVASPVTSADLFCVLELY